MHLLIYFPFCTKEEKQPTSEENPIKLNITRPDPVTAGSSKAVCVTQSLSAIHNRAGLSYAYFHKRSPGKPAAMVSN